MFLHVLRLPSQQFPADTARQRGWWEPHLQRRHLARASHPAHCAPNMLREAGETLFWLGTCHGGCPWARRAKPSKKHHVAMALPACQCQLGTVWTFPHEVPVPASQQAPVGQAKPAAAPPQNASKKPAASKPKPGHPASFPLAAGGGHPNQHKAPSAGS